MQKHLASVFMSHATQDKEVAIRLRRQLIRATASTVFFYLSCDRESVSPGELWPDTITKALDDSNIMFVLVSAHSERSEWVLFEAGYASGAQKPVVPILMPSYPRERFRPPLQLRQYIAIDDPESLGDVVRKLNRTLQTDFPSDFTQSDLEEIFGAADLAVREHSTIKAVPLVSRDAIYSEIVKLVRASGRQVDIRATSMLDELGPEGDTMFDSYISAVAQKCGDAERRGDAASYTVVMSFVMGEDGLPPEHKQRSIRKRQKAFEEAGAANRISVRQTPERWRMDILLVGEEHLFVGWPPRADDLYIRHGVRISGREFVSYIAKWFDLCVRPGAMPLDRHSLRVVDDR